MSIIGNDCLRALALLQVQGDWKEIKSVNHPIIESIKYSILKDYILITSRGVCRVDSKL